MLRTWNGCSRNLRTDGGRAHKAFIRWESWPVWRGFSRGTMCAAWNHVHILRKPARCFLLSQVTGPPVVSSAYNPKSRPYRNRNSPQWSFCSHRCCFFGPDFTTKSSPRSCIIANLTINRSCWFDSGSDHQPTTFTSVPIGSMVIRISSPWSNVNESGGTIPVPVKRKQPLGKELSR